tara:strand:+ start:10317 stop:11828 length:1512 start_codon:yes stop_codon:yes gene_type:complete
MATIELKQQPKLNPFPATQDVIFAVSENNIVANNTKVKFIANVYIDWNKANLGTSVSLVATLKTTPNNAGIGMFDLRPILESYVNSDNIPEHAIDPQYLIIPGFNNGQPRFKTSVYANNNQFPIHLIDKYSCAKHTIKWLKVKFQIEYLGADASEPNEVSVDTDFLFTGSYLYYNGYLSKQDVLDVGTYSNNFGWNLEKAGFDLAGNTISYIQNSPTSKFLTNCPTIQYARLSDYGTIATFNTMDRSFTTGAPQSGTCRVDYIEIKMYNSANAQIGSTIQVDNLNTTGGYHNKEDYALTKYLFAGVYPANLRGWSTDFQGQLNNISYYTVQAFGANHTAITQIYTINIICQSSFGYEGIRLAWLNKFGAWDYYTFNQRSVRSINTSKKQYTQNYGSWNKEVYRPHGYKGGMKNFRVDAKESIKINTDYLNDLESSWMQELINSPEVYIINEYSADDTPGIINKYVEPVILKSTNYTRKTKANDKLIQYTFDLERNANQRTQAV